MSKDIIARPREDVKGEDAFFQSFACELISRPVGKRKKVGWHNSSIQPVSFNHGLARGLISPKNRKPHSTKTGSSHFDALLNPSMRMSFDRFAFPSHSGSTALMAATSIEEPSTDAFIERKTA